MMMVAVVALFVLGPDRLPGAVRETSIWINRIRRHISDIKREVDEQIDELEDHAAVTELYKGRKLLDDVKRDLEQGVNKVGGGEPSATAGEPRT
jgi:sec-independent protein translocase protein TatB